MVHARRAYLDEYLACAWFRHRKFRDPERPALSDREALDRLDALPLT